MMKTRKFLVSLVSCFMLCILMANAQDRSNRGKEFWLAYGFDYTFFNETPVNSQNLAVYISTTQAATVTVSVTNTGFSQTLNIPANTVDASIIIPKAGPNDARTLTDGLQNRNVHIVSDVDVAVYAHVYATQVSGATMLMPVETFGYEYFSINYYQTTSQSSPNDWYSWFYVVASEDNTVLQITPVDTTKNGWLPGTNNLVTLNKGESFHVFGKALFNGDPTSASKDMTGSRVLALPGPDGRCHPFALFSGSGGIRLCRGDGGEFMQQQVFPSQAWGTRYLTYHTINNTSTDLTQTNRSYYRICVKDPTTIVKRNGIPMTGLVKNFFYEHLDSTGGDYYEADKPMMVSQYMVNKNQCWNFPTTTPSPPSYGDPEMFYLSPIEQGQKSVLFYTSRKDFIEYVYTNILIPTGGLASLRVDGNIVPATQVLTHPSLPSHSVALYRFTGPAAQHSIISDSNFTATVYGLGNYESYGYNVGTLVNNLNYYSSIANVNNINGQPDSFTCKNTAARLFVKLSAPATSITWRLSQVAGISPNIDSVQVSPVPIATELINGRTYYIYTLQQNFVFSNEGTFYLPVSYTSTVSQNCSQTDNASVKIVVKTGPKADFTWQGNLCQAKPIVFNGTGSGSGFNFTSYNWLFDDNSTATGLSTTKQFATSGSQAVKLTVIANNGCVGDTIKTVNIEDAPVARLGITPAICAGDSVLVTDTSSASSGTINMWRYDFGNMILVKNIGAPFSHPYLLPGTYNVKLTVTKSSGCESDTSRQTVVVTAKSAASFSVSGNVCLGNAVTITDNSLVNSPIPITAWRWIFGDGNTVLRTDGSPFTHLYATAGTYDVLLVTSGGGACFSDTARQTVIVTAKPDASFSIAGKSCVDSSLLFTSATAVNPAIPGSWYWNFGDGSQLNNSTSHTVLHSYSAAATNVTVVHVVTLGGCRSDTVKNTIPIISNNPVAGFTILSDTLCERQPVSIAGNASPDVTNWNWNFGNGTATLPPPLSRSYAIANTYNISLTVGNATGCASTPASKVIVVASAPLVNAGPDIFMKPGVPTIINASLQDASAHAVLWSPTTSLIDATILKPMSTAVNDLVYSITATNRVTGCSASDAVDVKMITDIFVPSAFVPAGINKTWSIPALRAYPKAGVIIYNRYGQKIFESIGYTKPWDGRFKGNLQPAGAYVYIIRPNDGITKELKGTVMLIR